jgi:hypothetical protein
MLLSSSSTLVGIHVFPLTIGIAMTFNKRNIVAYDIGYADTKRWSEGKPSSTAPFSPLSAAATSQSTVMAVAAAN